MLQVLLLLVAQVDGGLVEAPVTEVKPQAGRAGASEFPRALFWSDGAALVPLVCVEKPGARWRTGAACKALVKAPGTGFAKGGPVQFAKWEVRDSTSPAGGPKETVLGGTVPTGANADRVVVAPAWARVSLKVTDEEKTGTIEGPLRWTAGTVGLTLARGRYRGKRPDAMTALTHVVTTDGAHTWDASPTTESLIVLATLDLNSDGKPEIVVLVHEAECDEVVVLDADLRQLASFTAGP